MRQTERRRVKTNGTGFSNEASAKIRAGSSSTVMASRAFIFAVRASSRVPLPGLPWSPQFMEVYEAALSGQPLQIGASRTKPGTVSAAIIGYYYDQSFLALAPSYATVTPRYPRTLPCRTWRQAHCLTATPAHHYPA